MTRPALPLPLPRSAGCPAAAATVAVEPGSNHRWHFPVDLKYVDMDTRSRLLASNSPPGGNSPRGNVDVDPFVVGAGIGLRF